MILVAQVANYKVHGYGLKKFISLKSSCHQNSVPMKSKRFTDKSGLHAYFFGYKLEQHPLVVIHFRPHLLPDKQILGESMYHLQKTLPRSLREAGK